MAAPVFCPNCKGKNTMKQKKDGHKCSACGWTLRSGDPFDLLPPLPVELQGNLVIVPGGQAGWIRLLDSRRRININAPF